MNNNYFQLHLILKLLYLNGESIKKSHFKNTNSTIYLQEFKLKLLNSDNTDIHYLNLCLNELVKKDLDTLLLLKLISTFNFKDRLDQHHSNRTLVNTLNWTYSNITSNLLKNEVENNESDPYVITFLIQNLYFFYKIYHQLNLERNEKYLTQK